MQHKTDYNPPEMTWQTLCRTERQLAMPFALSLTDTSERLVCEEMIRIIPGKRMVVFGTWGEQAVVAKLFYEPRKALKHLIRDAQGIEKLIASNVPTPKLLYQGKVEQQRIHVLIFECIVGADNLDTLWQGKTDVAQYAHLMHAVTIELATQHVLGILQQDLHLKNFLLTEEKIFTLDGGDIEKVERPLSKKESLDHLGLFFAQLGVGSDDIQKALFKTYTHARGWIVKPNDVLILDRALKKWLKKRCQRYQKKISRNCTAFAKIQTPTELMMYDRQYESDSFAYFLKNPEAVFSQFGTEILKSGRSTTVIKINLDDRTYVVKRYNLKNGWHWLRRCLRPSRAAANWQLAQHLRLMGIPTAKPVAFIEKQWWGLRSTSYFVMEQVEGIHAGDYFATSRLDDAAFLQVAKRVVTLLRHLFMLQLSHGDLKMTNILISQNRPVLIDLDGMRRHYTGIGLRRAFAKEIERFMRNWEGRPLVKKIFGDFLQS